MKNILFIFAIVLITIMAIYGGYKVVHITGKYPFCGSCHEWDGAIAQTNLMDTTHGANNKNGINITCTDCHLPHDNILRYILTKAKNGIREGITAFITGNPNKKDWLNNREHARKFYTFDSSCLRCHNNIFVSNDGNKTTSISKIHSKYLEFKNTNDEFKCTQCHKHVGHKNLGKILFEIKNDEPKTWQEWESMRNK